VALGPALNHGSKWATVDLGVTRALRQELVDPGAIVDPGATRDPVKGQPGTRSKGNQRPGQGVTEAT
jgi:hypothetical protein